MSLHRIKVLPLTAETFAPYGQIVSIPTDVDTCPRVSDRYNFWPKVATIKARGGNEFQIGISTLLKRPNRMDKIERHLISDEIMWPLTGDLIMPFALNKSMDKDEICDFTAITAFLVERNTGVLIGPGVWHWTPYPLQEEVSMICSFETDTQLKDLIVQALPKGEIVELCL